MIRVYGSILRFLMRSLVLAACTIGLTSCGTRDRAPAPREFKIQQNWQFQPGAEIAGHTVQGGLGDISINLDGKKVYAPFAGQVQPHQGDCVIFTSPQVPAYLMRLCGVDRPKFGAVRQGEAIASSQTLTFAVLRKQPDGTWAIVEPADSLLERVLIPSKA